MNKYDDLKILGKFYGKSVYGNPYTIDDLDDLTSAEDWKFLQFRGQIESEAPSLHECRIKLPNEIQLYLVKRKRTWLDYDWILLYADGSKC